ncbi:MAG: DEAD/DEAH box helicase, partial [Firmicutes bacterium]|nr:DEAD/DEAH box helicase [Bacillota bacterium]
PMKALAYDQLKEFKSLEKGTGIAFSPAVYDGDTPKSKRRGIRNKSRVILTNPHALHLYLSWHKLWQRFFSNLKFVVIDEAHWYRGIFGSNVAYLLRRLQRILDYYQNPEPQFILASATMADPVEHAQKLTGREFSLVARDGSAKGKKTYFFWDTTKNLDKSQHLQTAELFAACVENNLQTLCFTVSRKMSELTARWAQEKVKDVASYRAGYLAEERRELEEKFKKGEIRGLSSTNALELGINIGGLDAVVIGGYPGTVSSFHQQAGRAGRTGQESLVVQVLYENPLDSYMLTNPNYLFQEPTEQAVISLDNEHFLKSHLLCAAEELPLTAADSRWFGPRCSAIAEELRKEKKLVLKKKASKTKQAKETIYIKEYHCVDKGACFQVGLSSFERER